MHDERWLSSLPEDIIQVALVFAKGLINDGFSLS